MPWVNYKESYINYINMKYNYNVINLKQNLLKHLI